MKSDLRGPHPFARLLIAANGIFWLVFSVFFVLKSYPYRPHKPVFEERAPDLIYFGRALSYLENEQMRPLIRATFIAQWPSFYAASPLNFYFSRHGIVVDHQYGGVSAGGYYLLIVCVLSFLQWYLLGWFLDHLKRRFSASRGSDSPTPGHAYD